MERFRSLLRNNYVFWGTVIVLTVASQVAVFVFHWPIDPNFIPSHHLPPKILTPHVQNLPPMTDDQLYQAIINAKISLQTVTIIGTIIIALSAMNILFGMRVRNYPSWLSADITGLQVLALYFGFPVNVYFAVWWHMLTAFRGLWQVCAAYCLALLTIFGLYVLIRSFIYLSIKTCRLTRGAWRIIKLACLNLADNW